MRGRLDEAAALPSGGFVVLRPSSERPLTQTGPSWPIPWHTERNVENEPPTPQLEPDPKVRELADRVLSGNERATARACRWVDDGAPGARELLRLLYPKSRDSWLVGVTGTPGAGKSTLTGALVAAARARGQKVGVIAVDPTSPFSGGAILGDRIRMQEHFEDPEVFIRSVATRGALGGLSATAADLAVVLAAWGAHVVFLETVGVGQDELEIASVADTTLVVMAPGLGDDVQALKAGILECADVFAVNKTDRPGADAAVRDLELLLALASMSAGGKTAPVHPGHGAFVGRGKRDAETDRWVPPIVRTVAVRNEGVEELYEQLLRHRAQEVQAAERLRRRFEGRLRARLQASLATALERAVGEELAQAASRLADGSTDPYTECERLWQLFRARDAEI